MTQPKHPPPSVARRAITQRALLRYRNGQLAAEQSPDTIAVEEPLEVRVSSDPLVTLMRTPGEDHYLTVGFLFSEGIIVDLADVGRVAHCGRIQAPEYGNVIDVSPGPGVALAPERHSGPERATLANSACGVCGRRTIDDLLERASPVEGGAPVAVTRVLDSLRQLEEKQAVFGCTGAMHGALVCDADGHALAWSEDVGRHNAVDKVVGKLLYSGALSRRGQQGSLLAVTSRSCFEIVQKAAIARLATVVSVGAPTSLAIDLAQATGVTLIGFARDEAFNIYTHAHRILV